MNRLSIESFLQMYLTIYPTLGSILLTNSQGRLELSYTPNESQNSWSFTSQYTTMKRCLSKCNYSFLLYSAALVNSSKYSLFFSSSLFKNSITYWLIDPANSLNAKSSLNMLTKSNEFNDMNSITSSTLVKFYLYRYCFYGSVDELGLYRIRLGVSVS